MSPASHGRAYNVFLASPKDSDALAVAQAKAQVEAAFAKAVPGANLRVVEAAEEYRESFGTAGGWDAWTTHVACGVDFEFRTPLYNAIVCTSEVVGKATAQIVEKSLNNRKMVACIMGPETIKQVFSVEQIEADNWKAGWRVCTES